MRNYRRSRGGVMMNERHIASGIAAPQCGSCFSRHKSVIIFAALGCGDLGMAPRYCFGIVSFGLAGLLPHAVLKQIQIYLRPDKFMGFLFQFSQIHTMEG